MQPADSSQQPRRLEQSVPLASMLAWAESKQLPSSIMQTSCGTPQRGRKPRHAPGEQAHTPHPTRAHLTSAKRPWSQRRAANRIRGLILMKSAESTLGGRRWSYTPSPSPCPDGGQAGKGGKGGVSDRCQAADPNPNLARTG